MCAHAHWAETLNSSKGWDLVAGQVAATAELIKVTEMTWAVVSLVDYRLYSDCDHFALETIQL